MSLRVVALMHRAEDLAGSFVEAQNSYPPSRNRPFDAFVSDVEDCYVARFGDVRVEPETFGRDVGRLAIDATYEHEHFTKHRIAESTFHDEKLETCVVNALARVVWQSDDASPAIPSSGRVRIGVTLSFEGHYVVREAKAEIIDRCDVIRFRQADPRVPSHELKSIKVSGIRCATDAAYVARKILGQGRALLEREPVTQPGVDFSAWNEAYVRLPDGRDYGLELIRAGICDDSGENHPRHHEYRLARRDLDP
jgi:hypothetical protein